MNLRWLLVLLVIGSMLICGPLVEAKPRKFRSCIKLLWLRGGKTCDFETLAAVGISAAAVGADMHSTSLMLKHCQSCRETNPILGNHPSDKRLVLHGLAVTSFYAASTAVLARQEYDNEGRRRWPGLRWIVPAIAVPVHSLAADGNSKLPRR